jgi:hypothetical protein
VADNGHRRTDRSPDQFGQIVDPGSIVNESEDECGPSALSSTVVNWYAEPGSARSEIAEEIRAAADAVNRENRRAAQTATFAPRHANTSR